MILKDLDNQALSVLFRPELRAKQNGTFERVRYKDRYAIHWLAGAVWLRDDLSGRKVTVWDLGKYFQGPFVEALKAWKIAPEVQDQIAAMKKRRSLFTYREIFAIRKYCMEECAALAELGSELEQAHIDADLKPRSWFGPGSTATVLLNRHSIKEKRGIVAPQMIEPIACAFFGGRAEISTTGFVKGPISGYDISSAYPYHASILPCLEHGRWEKVTRERDVRGRGRVHALVHGHVHNARGDWGPLPIRLKNGTIVFPRSGGSGWWWRDEWLAAREGWKGLEFDRAYVLRQECECTPFSFLPELFARRVIVGKDTGAGKMLKLGPNSVYGKLAQRIGKAQFASRAWAGMITSGTRAQVLRLMLRHKKLENVLMIATDGLFSTEQHDVDPTIRLGGWERKDHESITLIRPGIYWLGDQKVRARGLGRDNLETARETLANALLNGEDRVELAPRVVFGGAKQCVREVHGQYVRSEHYGQWHNIPTRVSLAPAPKRRSDWSTPELRGNVVAISDGSSGGYVQSEPYGTPKTAKTGELFEILELLRDFMDG